MRSFGNGQKEVFGTWRGVEGLEGRGRTCGMGLKKKIPVDQEAGGGAG